MQVCLFKNKIQNQQVNRVKSIKQILYLFALFSVI